MKSLFLLCLSSLALYSCASGPLPQFKKETNCSPRALQHIGQSPSMELNGMSSIEAFKAAQSCYHELTSKGYSGSHNICLVMGVSSSGGINFIDVADYDNAIGSDLQKCIVDKVQKIDLSDFKDNIILQPLRVE